MKKLILIVFCLCMIYQMPFWGAIQSTQEEEKIEKEQKYPTTWLLIENWTGTYYHGRGTPYPANKEIVIPMNDFNIGINLLKHREKFLGPFYRNRITYEPQRNLPWFNIVENTLGLKWRPGFFQAGVEIAHIRYLPSAKFKNVGGQGWDFVTEDTSHYTAFRAFLSFWDDWRSDKWFQGEEWGQVYYHGPGTDKQPNYIDYNNVIFYTNWEMDLNLLRFYNDEKSQAELRYYTKEDLEAYENRRPLSMVQFFGKFNGAYDTKRYPWNNYYEFGLGLQLKVSSFRIGLEHIWGNFHQNAKFQNIGGFGWDMNPERPYQTWRVFANLWFSYRRDR